MKNQLLKLAVLCIALCSVCILPLQSQSLKLPHFCGFETENEKADWTFVNGNNKNQWVIGNATAMKGTRSLYISPDGGITAGVAENVGLTAVYKEYLMPAAGTYEISFDWKAKGGATDELYVCWVTDNTETIVSNTNGELPMRMVRFRKATLAGSTSWQNKTIQVQVQSNLKCKLVFYWSKKEMASNIVPPGACIDNVQIGRLGAGTCDRPSDLTVAIEPAKLVLEWKGSADAYNLMYKDTRTDNWIEEKNVSSPHIINYPDEGVYTFWLNSVCGTDTTIWSVHQYVVITDATKNCINYIDLYSDFTHPYYGTAKNPHNSVGIKDYGEESWLSRHTVNLIPDRYDEYTGYKLRTIPKGELASIRLGNSRKGAEAENITYDIVIDSASTIILLNYAVVLENAHIGAVADQARFTLAILDEDSVLIDDCALIDFVPEHVQDWNGYKMENSTEEHNVLWKDWTAIGVDVSEYIGEKIKVSLTTYDCLPAEHFGYAYFTLNCIPKKISGLTCGSTKIDSVSAPAGFNYEWYHIVDPATIVCEDQTYKITNPNDTNTYICRVISPEKPECFFEMKAVIAPRYPKAEAKTILIQENCQNKILFENTSYVYTVNGKTDDPIIWYQWDFGEFGTLENKDTLIVFDEPGEYPVSLKVIMDGGDGGDCADEWVGTIKIEPLGTVYDTLRVELCDREYYTHENKVLTTEGMHKFTYKTKTGCDSIFTIDLKFYQKHENLTVDTICTNELPYVFREKEYSETGVYNDLAGLTVHNCDSTYILNLFVIPEVEFSVSTVSEVNGQDGKIIIESYPEGYTHCALNGVENAPLDNLSSGEYELTVFTKQGTFECSATKTVEVGATCLVISVEAGVYETCGDNPEIKVPYTVLQGNLKNYDVSFDDLAVNTADFADTQELQPTSENEFIIPMPELTASEYVRPGHYTAYINFPDQLCDTLISIPFSIAYPTSILSQRWEKLLFVENADYNGGYKFSGYQWYKDEELLPGETHSYLHVPDGLDLSSEYRVSLTRSDDGVTAFTCPLVPYAVENVTLTLQSNIVSEGGVVQLSSGSDGYISLYSVSGVMLLRQRVVSGSNHFTAPSHAGYYLLKVELDDQQVQTYHLQVVK